MKVVDSMRVTLLTTVCLLAAGSAQAATPESAIPPDEAFFIKSVQAGDADLGYWDQPGRPQAYTPGTQIGIWARDPGPDQMYRFVPAGGGWYSIVSLGGGYLEVVGGIDADRIPLQMAPPNGSAAQKFRLRYLGEGRWKIYTHWGRALCTPRNYQNGSYVHTWGDHDGPWMEWYLVDAETLQTWEPGASRARHAAADAEQKVYTLEPGEELVYGKVGVGEDGDVSYTLAVVRKPNRDKTVYVSNLGDEGYGPRPIGETLMRPKKNPKPYDLYDYWLVFNGRKWGPYDRILDMAQDDPDPGHWVSADGKAISFSGVKGKKYHSVVNSYPGLPFWTTAQAPIYDGPSGQPSYGFHFGPDDFRFMERGHRRFAGWKHLDKVDYSDDGSAVLYVGGPTDKWQRSVYLNHEPVAGPYYIVSRAGFIPGTSQPYCYGFGRDHNYDEVVVGKRRIPVPDGDSVLTYPGDKKIVVRLETGDPTVPAPNSVLARRYQVYEYDAVSGELTHHGGYVNNLYVDEMNGDLYFRTVSPDGKAALVLGPGGKQLGRYPSSEASRMAGLSRVLVDRQGNYTIVRRKARKGGSVEKAGQFTFVVERNGKILRDDVPGVFLEHLRLNHAGSVFMVTNLDSSVGSVSRRVACGDVAFRQEGRVRRFHVADDADVVFALQEDGPDGPVQIQRNGAPVDATRWPGVAAFTVTPDGRSYAMMTPRGGDKAFSYRISNRLMSLDWQLVVDGEPLPGRFGAAAWSGARGRFIALAQQGRDVVIVPVGPARSRAAASDATP